MIQRHELLAWLGDDHGLTESQTDELATIADEIAERYPDPDDQADRDAALIVAYRLMRGESDIVEELGAQLLKARLAESRALAGLRQAALSLLPDRTMSESAFARTANLDRMAVRSWLGKR